jgi:hypothetical protein
MKLSLAPNPTFVATVDIPVHGGGSAPVKFTFRHRSKKDFSAWRDSLEGKADAECITDLASGWDLDDEFSAENIDRLLESYAGSGKAIFSVYLDEILQARRKN